MPQQSLYLDWNSDLLVTPNGGIQMAEGWDLVRQRIIRSLITNPSQVLPDGTLTPPDYIFDTAFGIGLGRMVAQAFDPQFQQTLQRRISRAVLQDSAVDSTAPPSVRFVKPQPDTLWIVISVRLKSGRPGTISLKVS